MKRYFIVMWEANHDKGQATGNSTATVDNGRYINRRKIAKAIEELQNVTGLAITNIIELSEADYNDWNAN